MAPLFKTKLKIPLNHHKMTDQPGFQPLLALVTFSLPLLRKSKRKEKSVLRKVVLGKENGWPFYI